MKKTIRIVALAGLIGLAATSCTKENVTDTVNVSNVSTVYYTSGADTGSALITDYEAWDSFMDRMLALAREGYSVTISGGTSQFNSQTKEVVTYTTNSEEAAKTWTKHMIDQGYSVEISYDDRTGIYTCTAVK